MIQPVVPPMSLSPDAYIYSLYEPPDASQKSLITHHLNASTNYYRGFTYLSSRLSICLYTKVYNGQSTLFTACVFNPWVVFISYWVSLVVCLSALSLGDAGSIYWLCTVALWPASHSGGEHHGASRTYLSVFKWLRNPVPCNGSVTSANGVRSRSTHIGSLGKLPTVLYSPGMAFKLVSQRDLEKGPLEFHYNEECKANKPKPK
jgi:hypothetical protein